MLCNGLHTHVAKGSLVLKRLPTNGRDRRGGILVSNPQVSTWGAKQVSDIPKATQGAWAEPQVLCLPLCLEMFHCCCESRGSVSPLSLQTITQKKYFLPGSRLWQGIYCCRPSLCLWTTCQYWHHIAGHHNTSPSCLLLLSCGLGSWCQGLLQPAADYWVVMES